MSTLDDLQAAGFSEGEVKGYAAEQRQTLSAAGFTDDEINQHLGVSAQPDTLAANKQFSRVVGDALTKASTALKASGETIADVGSVYAPIEAALNAGTGILFGFPAYVGAGLGGLVSKHLLGLDADPKELAETMSRVFTYQPMTQRGQRLAGNVMLPLTMLQEGAEATGHGVTNVAMKAGASDNVAAALGAVTDSTIQMLAPSLLGELSRKMGGQTVTADDMRNTAKVIAGPEATHEAVAAVEQGLQSTYQKTGIGPFTVLEDAHKDPQIAGDLADPNVEVPRAYEEHVEKPAPEQGPVPGDGLPVLDVSGRTAHEEAAAVGEADEVHAARDLLSAVDSGGIPLNPAKLRVVAEGLGLEVSRTSPPEETIQRIREAVQRADESTVAAGTGNVDVAAESARAPREEPVETPSPEQAADNARQLELLDKRRGTLQTLLDCLAAG